MHYHVLLDQCIGMMQVLNVVPPGTSQVERGWRQAEVQRLVAEARMPMGPPSEELCRPPKMSILCWGAPRGRRA